MSKQERGLEADFLNRSRSYTELGAHVPLGGLGLRETALEDFVEMSEARLEGRSIKNSFLASALAVCAGNVAVELGLKQCGFPERTKPPTIENDSSILDPYLERAANLFSIPARKAERDPKLWTKIDFYQALLYRPMLPLVYALPPRQRDHALATYRQMLLRCIDATEQIRLEGSADLALTRFQDKLILNEVLNQGDTKALLPWQRQGDPHYKLSTKWHISVWHAPPDSTFSLSQTPHLKLLCVTREAWGVIRNDPLVTPLPLSSIPFLGRQHQLCRALKERIDPAYDNPEAPSPALTPLFLEATPNLGVASPQNSPEENLLAATTELVKRFVHTRLQEKRLGPRAQS